MGSSAERLRIVSLVDDLRVGAGGGEKFAIEAIMRLNPDRFERILCTTRRPTASGNDRATAAVTDELRAAGVRLLELRRRSRLQVWQWRALYEVLRTMPIDILHAHMFGSNAWGAVLGTLARTPW